MAASMTHASRMGTNDTSGSAADQEFDFNRCTVQKTATHIDPPGIRGGRSHDGEGVVDGTYTVGGAIALNPRPDDLDEWLPRIAGGTKAVDIIALAETLPDWGLDVEKVADVYRYAGMKVNSATFRSSQDSQALELEMDVQGKTETGSLSFADIAASLTDLQPYTHYQCTVTLDSTPYTDVFRVEVTISNALILDRFGTAQTRSELPEGDRIITVTLDMPFTSTEEAAFYDLAVAGIDAEIKYTAAPYEFIMTFVQLQKAEGEGGGPVINARGEEIGQTMVFTAREDHSAGTKELIFDNDSAA